MTSHPRDGSHSAAARKARTRHLIELGGLVQKAGLVELTGDDRAAILGALLEAAETLQGDTEGIARENRIARWRHRGRREFEEDQAGRE